MNRNTVRRFVIVALAFAVSAIDPWPRSAEAFHLVDIVGTVTSIDSVTRQVDINITETTTGSGTPHVGAIVAWGDTFSSFQPWTSTTGTNPKFYAVSASHTYPDLTTRIITINSDSNAPSPLVDTVAVDFGCSDSPLGLCAAAGKSLLQFKNNSDDTKDKFKFKWLKGNTTFPDPATTQYFVCVYAPGLVFDAIIPDGAPWVASGATGFKYQDDAGTNGGILKMKVKSGSTSNAKIIIKGGGGALDDPLPLTQPVLVQIQANNTVGDNCWEHSFSSPEKDSTADAFKDKEP